MKAQRHLRQFRAMASPCEVVLWSEDAVLAQRALDAVEVEVRRIEAKYSRYLAHSVLAHIQAAAGGAPITLDAETANLLDYAQAVWAYSGGLFDPTSGVLREVWDFRSGCVPAATAVQAVLARVGWARVRWCNPVLQLPVAGMQLDFGGFGKEYAVDRAIGVLQALDCGPAMVNLGGDLRVTAPQPGARPWSIGIVHPRRPGQWLGRLEMMNGALATSGDYERCMVVEGVRYSHVLDPRSGWPVQGAMQVSVAAPSCLVAGTAATCALLAGHAGWQTLQGRAYLWVAADGTLRAEGLTLAETRSCSIRGS